MASIWKELLFLHGHFIRPEDVVDVAVERAPDTSRTFATGTASASTAASLSSGALACEGHC